MRLLFDQNISRSAVSSLRDFFPDSTHVFDVALDAATDREIWEYAEANDLVIVSKDSDFRLFAFLQEPPPKAIWVRVGNVTTTEIVTLLLDENERIIEFGQSAVETLLVLDRQQPSQPGGADGA